MFFLNHCSCAGEDFECLPLKFDFCFLSASFFQVCHFVYNCLPARFSFILLDSNEIAGTEEFIGKY